VTVKRDGVDQARALQHVGAGEFFVSRAFLTGAPSTIDLVADGEVMVVALESVKVTDFLNRNPRLARLFESAIDASESGLAMAPDDTRLRVVRS
jgi:hypothetical protein